MAEVPGLAVKTPVDRLKRGIDTIEKIEAARAVEQVQSHRKFTNFFKKAANLFESSLGGKQPEKLNLVYSGANGTVASTVNEILTEPRPLKLKVAGETSTMQNITDWLRNAAGKIGSELNPAVIAAATTIVLAGIVGWMLRQFFPRKDK